jgi:hypothetical protein
MSETVGIALVPVLTEATPGSSRVTVWQGSYLLDCRLQFFAASTLLDGLNDIGGDGL